MNTRPPHIQQQPADESLSMSVGLGGKVALVVDATGLQTEHLARVLLAAGSAVMLAGADIQALQPLADEQRASGGQIALYGHDVVSAADWQALVTATQDCFGGLDLLVNSVGLTSKNGYAEDCGDTNNQDVIRSVSLGMQHAMLSMCPDGLDGRGGTVINLLSLPGGNSDCMSEEPWTLVTSLQQMSRMTATEYKRQGYEIRVHCVIQNGYQPMGSPTDVAYAVLYLASDAARWVTGTEMVFESSQHAV